MFTQHGRIASAVVMAALCAGCATVPRGPVWEGTPGAGGEIQVTIDNKAFLDVVIYSEIAGSRVRLGPVCGGFTETFAIPHHQEMAGTLRLVADPIGSRQVYYSEPVTAVPGQEVRWVVHESRGVRALTVW